MFGLGKGNAAIDAFSQEVCGELAKRFPPARESELGGDKSKAGVTLGNAYAHLERRVVAFQAEHKLGVYGKARLLQATRDELTRLGYGEAFIKATIELLVKSTATSAG